MHALLRSTPEFFFEVIFTNWRTCACLQNGRVGGGDVVNSHGCVGKKPEEEHWRVCKADLGRSKTLPAEYQHHYGAAYADHGACSGTHTLIRIRIQNDKVSGSPGSGTRLCCSLNMHVFQDM